MKQKPGIVTIPWATMGSQGCQLSSSCLYWVGLNYLPKEYEASLEIYKHLHTFGHVAGDSGVKPLTSALKSPARRWPTSASGRWIDQFLINCALKFYMKTKVINRTTNQFLQRDGEEGDFLSLRADSVPLSSLSFRAWIEQWLFNQCLLTFVLSSPTCASKWPILPFSGDIGIQIKD